MHVLVVPHMTLGVLSMTFVDPYDASSPSVTTMGGYWDWPVRTLFVASLHAHIVMGSDGRTLMPINLHISSHQSKLGSGTAQVTSKI
jgi:hypothetical protein